VRFKNAYEPRLLVYLLELLAKTGRLEHRFTGSTIKHLTRESLIELPVPVPPLDEQRRIVGEIEEQLTRLDAGIAALKRVQANLKRYRAAVLKAACEGRLVPTEATLARQEARRYEPASALLQRVCADRERVFAPQTQTGHQGRYTKPAEADSRDLPRLPEGWALASLEQLTSATRPICYGILMPKEHIPGGVLYVKVKDMKGDRIEPSSLQRTSPEIAARYRRSALLPGDVLLAIRGTYGRVVPAPPELQGGNITQDTVRLDVSAEVDSNYITWCLRSDDVQRYFKRVARGVAVKGVNVGDIRRTPIALPPLEEQHRIVTEIERHFSLVGALDQVVSTNLRRATRLRQSVLFALFPGRPAARVERVAPDGLAIVPKETAAYPAGPKVE
jgi:type I restriction enzyme S subunit